MSAHKLNVVIFLGSTREVRNADRVAAFVKKALEEQHFSVKILDPKVLQLPLLQTPFHYMDPTKAPKNLVDANEDIKNADAYVFVTGEYNRSFQPAMKNMIDHFSPNVYAWKPALILPYSVGNTAGCFAAQAWLPVFREMGLYVTPGMVAIATVEKALSADGQLQPTFEYLKGMTDLAISQLKFLGITMKKGRTDQKPPKVHAHLPN